MKCGTCACASFKPESVNGCLALMPVGDKRRELRVTPETECFTGKYCENKKNVRLRTAINIEKLKGVIG